jgi:ribosome biogenesis SPOUT family RNA methylase Rps3
VQVAELVKEFEGRFKLVPESVIELVEEGAIDTSSTCMLDLRAEKELSP